MKRALGAAVLAVTIAAGCNGFPKPIPWREAEHKPEHYLTYEASPEVPFVLGQQRWLLLPGAVTTGPTWMFANAGGTAGAPVMRLVWDDAPFDQLYMQAADGLLHIAAELR
jgi:hypothetical protein